MVDMSRLFGPSIELDLKLDELSFNQILQSLPIALIKSIDKVLNVVLSQVGSTLEFAFSIVKVPFKAFLTQAFAD